jgi:murein DD-endopeptidase MepM/ murein hydrolase activator NlpD
VTDPMGIIPVTARISEIRASIVSLSDAIVPTGVSGVYTTQGAAAAATGGSSFASVLAEADAAGAVDVGTGGPVSAAWSIPWLNGSAPAQHLRTASDATTVSGGAPASASVSQARGAAAAGLLGARGSSASDDPMAVSWPLKGRISQHYGPTTSTASVAHTINGVYYAHFHDGIDIAAPVGRDVKAIAPGKVIFAGTYPDGARVVRVKHADGSISLYAHLKHDLAVKKGDYVDAGEKVGEVGMTGNSKGPHLHLELLVKGEDYDPEKALRAHELPGADGKVDRSVLPATYRMESASAALAAFDRVADDIPYHALIRRAAVAAGVDPMLLASIVKAESSFHPTSTSKCGAMGLMQLMPATAKALGVTDPYDPEQNLRAGAKYFAKNLKLYGRVDLALAAYQAGKGAVARAGGIPDSPTTRHYIDRILRSWAGYQEAAT